MGSVETRIFLGSVETTLFSHKRLVTPVEIIISILQKAEKAAAGKNKIHKVTFSVMLWYIAITHTLDL